MRADAVKQLPHSTFPTSRRQPLLLRAASHPIEGGGGLSMPSKQGHRMMQKADFLLRGPACHTQGRAVQAAPPLPLLSATAACLPPPSLACGDAQLLPSQTSHPAQVQMVTII